MVSSSIAERMPPWTKPAGLQKSFLPSKPIRTQPSFGRASIRCQPSSFDDGGAVKLSRAVAIMGTSVRFLPRPALLPAWCQHGASETKPVRDRLAHHVGQRFTGQRRDRYKAHALGGTCARGDVSGVNHQFQWKVREDVGDDARLAVPARHAFKRRRLLQRYLVILPG